MNPSRGVSVKPLQATARRRCVRARGGLMLRKQIMNRVKGAEETKRVSKRATVMQARKPTVDIAALGSEERRIC